MLEHLASLVKYDVDIRRSSIQHKISDYQIKFAVLIQIGTDHRDSVRARCEEGPRKLSGSTVKQQASLLAQHEPDGNVGLPIPIKVTYHHSARILSWVENGSLIEGPIAFAVPDRNRSIAGQVNRNVVFSISVEITDCG
jgi:hypothetical protein